MSRSKLERHTLPLPPHPAAAAAVDRIRDGRKPTAATTYADAPKVGKSGKDLRKVGS